MRKQRMKTVNQTFSIPLDISQELHTFVKRREMSRFVSNAIRKELKEKKDTLRSAYIEAAKDKGQKETALDWEGTISDGSEDW